jgi:diguanylate cyclase (GGDEF)-like protein/PAS domain S-box-containing protein
MTRRIPLVENKRRRKIAAPAKHTANRSPLINRFPSKTKPRKTPGPKSASDLESDLFRTMMDNTTDRIYFKDKLSRFLLVNRAQAKMFGLNDPAEAVGKSDFDFFTENHAQSAYTDEQKIISTGEPLVGLEEKETWPDGHETWVSTTKVPMRDRQGRIIGTFGISRDITEHKKGEAARIAATVLRESNFALEKTNAELKGEIAERRRAEQTLAYERDLFRTMMDNISDHIYFKDAESRFLLINRAQASMFGLDDPSKAIGKTDFDFFAEEHARQAYNDEQQIIASGMPLAGMEEKETWPGGRETWVSTTKVPMRDREGRIIGTFGISRDITDRKTMELSVHMANDKLAEMVNWLEGRNREINVLNKMGELLETCRTPEEAYPVISDQMDNLIPVQAGRLFLLNKESGQYSVAASWGEDPDRTESFSPQDCRCIQSGSIYIVNTADPGLYCPHLRLGAEEEPLYLCIPLKDQGETIGVLHLRNLRDKGGPETRLDLKQELATTAADHIALALANLSLRETLRIQSIRDALTGLFNRRYLEESLQRELARAQRKAALLGVVMLDVDHLKQVNDLYGHEAGDTLLAVLGHWLQSNIRAEDISCRYGGDEFVLILPDASLESTYQRARQICEGVRLLEINHHDRSLGSATVSIGVAGFPENGQTRDALLSAVDEALYKAKERGRNCVVAAVEKTSPS